MDDEFDRAARVFGADMARAEKLAKLLNPELLFSDRHVSATVIDLQRKYKIEFKRLPTLFRHEEWEAIDTVTFDPDPESRWHIRGTGRSTTEATSDLLEKLTAELLKGA